MIITVPHQPKAPGVIITAPPTLHLAQIIVALAAAPTGPVTNLLSSRGDPAPLTAALVSSLPHPVLRIYPSQAQLGPAPILPTVMLAQLPLPGQGHPLDPQQSQPPDPALQAAAACSKTGAALDLYPAVTTIDMEITAVAAPPVLAVYENVPFAVANHAH